MIPIIKYVKKILTYIYRTFRKSINNPRIIYNGIVGSYKDISGKNIVSREIDSIIDGFETNVSLIFSTSKGIFIFDKKNNISKQILNGHSYGITRSDNYWFVQRTVNRNKNIPKYKRVSNIVKFKIKNYCVQDLSIVILGLKGEIHQIDIIGEELFIPYTGFNRILHFNIDGRMLLPRLEFNLSSINLSISKTSHLNSIYSDGQCIYVIAHNQTAHTNRSSELIRYSKLDKTISIQDLNAHSAHNIIYINESIYFCDSNNNKLFRDNNVIFQSNKLLRGLSMTDDRIYVGGSDIDFIGDKRYSSNATVYILNTGGNQVGQLDFPGLGNIYEIRQLNGVDYSLSNWRNNAKE